MRMRQICNIISAVTSCLSSVMAGAVQKHPDLEGFICPQCMVKFPSDVRVRAHWVEFHAGVKKPEKAKTERVSR